MASGACLAVLCLDKFPAEAKVLLQVVHVRWLVFIGLNLVLLAVVDVACCLSDYACIDVTYRVVS